MTQVRLALSAPTFDGTGRRPSGSLEWRPTKRRDLAGDVILPAPFTVGVGADTPPVIDVDPTEPGWAWQVVERVQGGSPHKRLLLVPDVGTVVDYVDLDEIDPATLDPVTLSNAWWTQVTDYAQPLGDYATNTALTSGLAGKVNTATYTAGLAGKQDTATLVADVAGHVADGSALDAALKVALGRSSSFVVETYGAKADGKQLTDGVTTSGSAVITSATAGFAAGDVGKSISITAAGTSGGFLITTIASVQSTTQATLAAPAQASLTGAVIRFGTDNATAFSSAMSACAAGGGGEVWFTDGPAFYLTSQPITLPTDTPVHLRGLGHGFAGTSSRFVQIMRMPGVTTPLISGVGTSTAGNTRIHPYMSDLMLHGGDGSGTLVKLQRASNARLSRLMFGFTTGTLLQSTEWFNSHMDGCHFVNGGSGGGTPAVLFDSASAASDGASGNTLDIRGCIWEQNTGTDLRVTGNGPGAPVGQDWTVAMQLSNIKMERDAGSFPMIDLDRVGGFEMSNFFLHLGPAATGTHIVVAGTPAVPMRSNDLTAGTISGDRWTGAGTGGAAAVPYFIDHQAGVLTLSSVSMNGSPTTAFVHVGSAVGPNDLRMSNVPVSDRSKLIADDRPGSVYTLGSIPLVPVLSGVAATSSVNRAVWILPDAATTTLTMANVPLPADLSAGRPLRIRLHWYSDVNAGAIRWNVGLKLLDASGEDITAGQADVFATATVPATANRTTTTTLTTTATDLAPGTTFASVYVARIGADAADTATGGGRLLAAEILYERAM